jgi:hypothetical protein
VSAFNHFSGSKVPSITGGTFMEYAVIDLWAKVKYEMKVAVTIKDVTNNIFIFLSQSIQFQVNEFNQ